MSSQDYGISSRALLPPKVVGLVDAFPVIRTWRAANLAAAIASVLARDSHRGPDGALMEACEILRGYGSVSEVQAWADLEVSDFV